MKIESPDIPHKTEAGMVKLGLDTAETAEAAFHDIMTRAAAMPARPRVEGVVVQPMIRQGLELVIGGRRSEEHTSELQSLMRISYDVFCLQQKTKSQLRT